jgi:hypothetical protein
MFIAAAIVCSTFLGMSSVSAQEAVSRSVTVTPYVCPAGMTAETLDPSLCTIPTSGFNLLIGSLEGEMEPYDLGDASSDGTSFTWDLASQGPGTTTRWYIRSEVAIVPDTTYIVTGDVVGPYGDHGDYQFNTSYELPNPVLSVYNFIPAEEPEASTITIHQRICDSSYTGGDLFEECHGNILGEAYELSVGDEVKATDPATGNVTFTVTGDFAVMADSSGANVDFILSRHVYCSFTESGEPLEISHGGQGVGYGTVIYFPAGSDITCDWYQFLTDVRPGDPSPTTTPNPSETPAATTTPVVVTLPGTGAGSNSSSTVTLMVGLSALLLLGGGLAMRRRTS